VLFAIGAIVYVSRATGFTFTADVSRNPSTSLLPTISGTPKLDWSQDVNVQPAGPAEPQLGDVWTLTVGGTTYTLTIASISVNGSSVTVSVSTHPYTIAAAPTPAGTVAQGFRAALTAATTYTVSVNGADLFISSADGSPVAVGPLTQQRRAATLEAPTTTGPTQVDSTVHYSTAIFTLTSDQQTAWSAGETWTVTINGRTFSFQVPATGPTGTLATIAAGLKLAIDADPDLSATVSDATITVHDDTGITPFTLKVSRGNGGLTGVFDIDFANTVSGFSQVPVVLPQYQWLVDLIPWLRPYLQTIDLLHFDARPAFQLLDSAGNVLKTVTCTIQPGSVEVQGQATRPLVCSNLVDLGSRPAPINPQTGLPDYTKTDPLLTYTFTQAGKYFHQGRRVDRLRQPDRVPRRPQLVPADRLLRASRTG